MNEPMNCPFCGTDDISVSFSYGNDQNKKAIFVECGQCAAFGPSMDLPDGDEEDAVTAWNDRISNDPRVSLTKFRILKPYEQIQQGDCWFDFDDGKWWQFEGGALTRKASDYKIVARLK